MEEYNEYKKVLEQPDLNSGLLRKCLEAKWKGKATEFEGNVVKSMSMSAGLTKKMLQMALGLLTSAAVPVDLFVLPQLLSYAQEHSAGPKGGAPSKPSEDVEAAAAGAIVSASEAGAESSAGSAGSAALADGNGKAGAQASRKKPRRG